MELLFHGPGCPLWVGPTVDIQQVAEATGLIETDMYAPLLSSHPNNCTE